MDNFYVYAFLRDDRYTPYYIGKGSRKRHLDSHGRCCARPQDKSRIVKVKEGLTEEESYELEKTLIKFWGRKLDGGILMNIQTGGDGGFSGRKESEEHKKWRGQLISEGYRQKTRKEWEKDCEYRLECSTQRQPIVYEGVSYRSLNECSRSLMNKYGVSRNTVLRYIKEGRSLSDTKRNKKYYKGTYTGTKYL